MTDQPQPMPTFASNWDRLVYLLAEYKVPLSIMALSSVIILAVWTPKVPKPPAEAVHFAAAAFLLAIPTYIAGMRIARYLYPGPDWVFVGIADPGTADSQTEQTGIYDGKKVKPDVWEQRNEVEMSPLEPSDGKFDYVVTRFNWYSEIGELEVRGADQTTLTPAEAWVNASRVDTIFDHHQSLKRQYAHLKRNVSEKITDVHDATIMTEIAEHEQSDLVPGVEIINEIEDMESDVKDLPDAPAQDDRTPRERALDLEVADSVDDAMDDLRPEGGRAAATDGGVPDE